jgi:hypothetical protein
LREDGRQPSRLNRRVYCVARECNADELSITPGDLSVTICANVLGDSSLWANLWFNSGCEFFGLIVTIQAISFREDAHALRSPQGMKMG